MKPSWRWWRRGGGCPCLRKEVAVLASQIREATRLASPAGRVNWGRRSLPRFMPRVLHCCPNGSPPVLRRFVVPYALHLSTAPRAPSRRPVSSQNEDDEEDWDDGARVGLNAEDREGDEGSETEEWEEEDDADPRIGDGGDGGGISLGNVAWGERALSLANEVLCRDFGDDLKLFAFKISPRGYIYVRLDKISNRYGCPEMEEMEKFSRIYDERLTESGEKGEMPEDLGLEVSSPGAERLLKVPEDLERFREMPMLVRYLDEEDQSEPKSGVFLLDAVEPEAHLCVWKLADVKENRDPKSKGRPMSRQRRDWRLKVPFRSLSSVLLYVP